MATALCRLLLCDVDGVLADFTGAVLSLVEAYTGRRYTRADVTSWSYREALGLTPEEWRDVSAHISQPGFARRLEPLPAAEELRRLIASTPALDVQFVTSPWRSSPTWYADREAWLCDTFGRTQGRRVTFTSEKHHVAGDWFVDDSADHVRAWVEAQVIRRHPEPWHAFVWDAPYNRGETRGVRVSSFADVMRHTRGAR